MTEKLSSASKPHILIVDNDPVMRLLMREALPESNYIVSEAESGSDALVAVGKRVPDIVLLDIRMPEMDGFEVCTEIRKKYGYKLPIIMVTGLDDINNKVNGLEIGADDYITKPFEAKELQARIHSVLRRAVSGQTGSSALNANKTFFAGWQLNTIKKTLTSPEGELIDMTSSEYRVLEALTRHSDSVLSRDEILAIISGREWSPLDRSADMVISKLRKKIEQDPKKPILIKTIRNRGYQLTAEIESFK